MTLKYKINITPNKDLYRYNQSKVGNGPQGGFNSASGNFVTNNELIADAHDLWAKNHRTNDLKTLSIDAYIDENGIAHQCSFPTAEIISYKSDVMYQYLRYKMPSAMTIAGGDDPIKPKAQGGGGMLNRSLNYLGNIATAAGMTIDWALGTGLDNKKFVNDNVSKAFMNANRVNEARNFYYKKYSGAKSLANTSVTGYKGSFGLSGLWNAGLDPIEQFVGTYRINVYNFNGSTLWFVLTNQTSMNSFLYDLGPSWQRSSWGPGGNMNQIYIWSEPVRK